MADVVYAFEWCPCQYDSSFGVQSLHDTKRGAFKAMVRFVNAAWHSERLTKSRYRYHNALAFAAWRVRAINVNTEAREVL